MTTKTKYTRAYINTALLIVVFFVVGIIIRVVNIHDSLNSLKIHLSDSPLYFLVPGSGDAWFNGTLQPHDVYVVPNEAHFIWFSCHEFDFINLLSLVSVYTVMKPDKIFFHTDCEPTGKWWREARLIPTLHVNAREPPKEVFGKMLNPKIPEHWSDVARLEVLRAGGVYFDTDIFVVAPLEPLRKYDYVVGRPAGHVLNNGVIFASPNSVFLKLFSESYRNYNPNCYSCSSVFSQHNLARKYKQYVHIENYSLVTPNFYNWRELFFDKFTWDRGHFTFHIWMKAFRSEYPDVVFTPQYINSLDSSFGEICRYIYYGNGAIIDEGSKPKPWWTNIKRNM